MKLPSDFLHSLEGVAGFNKEAFVAVHEHKTDVTSIRINPAKGSSGNRQRATGNEGQAIGNTQNNETSPLVNCPLPIADCLPVPWCTNGFYLSSRPSFTFDPLFHAGCYYVQEASSMFLEQAFKQLLPLSQPLKVLDLCASPGGKSTHIQSLISKESLLVSNEVIKQRSLALTDNIIKWGSANVFVTNNDPKAFQKLPAYFDVMVVDAPCSGSGLFRKDEEAINEWSLNNVALCSGRQQRILADALPALTEGGLLLYSTCSYSAEEDEAIADWLVGEMAMESLSLNIDGLGAIVQTTSPQAGAVGYRFYPDKIKGEGFFLACFRKGEGEPAARLRTAKPEAASAKEREILKEWIAGEDLTFFHFRDSLTALPAALLTDFSALQPVLNLRYAGVPLGEIMKDRLVPHHALAQSTLLKKEIAAMPLSLEDAVKYLQRQELSAQPQNTGWQVVQYAGQNLGWINALKNRINNYYPKEIRILKQHNNIAFEK